MDAKLYIVGTPIGNLGDITLRALETLRSVDYIACEDTRHSRPMLERFEVKARLIACHKFNEAEAAERIAKLVGEGKSVALITDAGMPSVSDPGAEVVSKCREMGIPAELVPGASALTGAVALAGVKAPGFVFLGFLPEKRSAAERALKKAAAAELPIIAYAAPHDVRRIASMMLGVLGDRKVKVCRELTKLHESVTETTLRAFECEERGEIVLIVEGAKTEDPLLGLSVEEHLIRLIESGVERKEAVKEVAAARNMPKNDVYQIALRL